MGTGQFKPETVDEYIASVPDAVRGTLETMRRAIRKAAPDAEETIKYHMPTYVLNVNLIHFAAYKSHIGIYPVPRTAPEFRDELSTYSGEKSTLQLPLDAPVPVDLIRRIVVYNAARNRERAESKKGRTR
jgi:uncharacterized protein YdhG (YjbR/CyaY superfamily)